MVTIEFVFESQNFTIQGNASDQFKKIINSFCHKLSVDSNELDFLVNGMIIDLEKTVGNYLKKSNEGKMHVVVTKKIKKIIKI